MRKLEGRIKALESRSIGNPWFNPTHRIVCKGQTEAEALDAYGRNRIGPNDNLIIRKIVGPKEGAPQAVT